MAPTAPSPTSGGRPTRTRSAGASRRRGRLRQQALEGDLDPSVLLFADTVACRHRRIRLAHRDARDGIGRNAPADQLIRHGLFAPLGFNWQICIALVPGMAENALPGGVFLAGIVVTVLFLRGQEEARA